MASAQEKKLSWLYGLMRPGCVIKLEKVVESESGKSGKSLKIETFFVSHHGI